MTEVTSKTSTDLAKRDLIEPNALYRTLAGGALVVKLITAATTYGIRHCLFPEAAATQFAGGGLAESSTQLPELTPEIRARLQSMLDGAKSDILEDGMRNTITERLPDLVDRDFKTVIPALVSVIEAGKTTPIIAAEILKEVGCLRNISSHASRRWLLERALTLPSPFVRDGAGLGLARLSDPGAIPYLRRAVDNEPSPEIRKDLQSVINELSEMIADGVPTARRE